MVAAFTGLWRSTAVLMPHSWRVRFVAHYREFAEGTCREIRLWNGGRRPGLSE